MARAVLMLLEPGKQHFRFIVFFTGLPTVADVKKMEQAALHWYMYRDVRAQSRLRG